MPIDVQVGDVVRLRKPHPCGSFEWLVVRIGLDIGLKCQTCGRKVMLPRSEFNKRVQRPARTALLCHVSQRASPYRSQGSERAEMLRAQAKGWAVDETSTIRGSSHWHSNRRRCTAMPWPRAARRSPFPASR